MSTANIGLLYGRSYELQIATGTAAAPGSSELTYKSAIVYTNYKRYTPIRMSFDVSQKENDQVQAQVQMLNLPLSTRNNIKTNSIVRLSAGYPTQFGLLVSGYVAESVTKRMGADVVTTIKMQSTPEGIEFGTFVKSYKGLVTSSQILHDIQRAGQIRINAGGESVIVPLQRGQYEGLTDVSYANGITFNCPYKEAIQTVLGADYAVRFNEQAELCITRKGAQRQDFRRVAVVLNEQTGLIGSPSIKYSKSVSAKLGNTVATGSVITFTSLLNPRLRVNGYCGVAYQGKQYYCRIQNSKFTGSTDDGPWQVECIATVIEDVTQAEDSGLTLPDEAQDEGDTQVDETGEGSYE